MVSLPLRGLSNPDEQGVTNGFDKGKMMGRPATAWPSQRRVPTLLFLSFPRRRESKFVLIERHYPVNKRLDWTKPPKQVTQTCK